MGRFFFQVSLSLLFFAEESAVLSKVSCVCRSLSRGIFGHVQPLCRRFGTNSKAIYCLVYILFFYSHHLIWPFSSDQIKNHYFFHWTQFWVLWKKIWLFLKKGNTESTLYILRRQPFRLSRWTTSKKWMLTSMIIRYELHPVSITWRGGLLLERNFHRQFHSSFGCSCAYLHLAATKGPI